jgi:hypothetical protein
VAVLSLVCSDQLPSETAPGVSNPLLCLRLVPYFDVSLLRFWARPTSATLLRLRLEVAPEALANKAELYKL